MKIMIAGLGSIGRRHLRNLVTLGERDILLFRTHRSTLPEADLAEFLVETDLKAALAHHPDAVIVSNPTALHLDVAIPVAKQGCHLFLEKPVSHSLERIDALQAAAEHGGGRVFIGYHYRFHPGLQQVKRLLQDGAIGRPLSARAHWGEYLPGWHPWEDYRQGYSAKSELGGGVILTLSHPLDYLRWLLGEVGEVWAFAGCQGDLELDVEDTAEIGLQFVSGALGNVHLDYNQRPPVHHLEINGTRGSLRWDNADGRVGLFRAPEKPGSNSDTGSWETFPVEPGFERNHLYLAEMRHFLAVARGEAEPLCTLEDGVAAMDLALAALRSAEAGVLVKV